jgi:hypothetical protein
VSLGALEQDSQYAQSLSQLRSLFNVDRAVLEGHYGAARAATTNKEKKITLENLGEYLFNCLDPCQCVEADLQSEIGEFDRIFEMASTEHALFGAWTPYFPLEAKNWKGAIGQALVREFTGKVAESHCTVGVYLSMNGYTEPACKHVREKSASQQIFLLHGEHIRQIIDGANLVDILRGLHRELHFRPRRRSISAL